MTKLTQEKMVEMITKATEDFFKQFEEKHNLEVPTSYINDCIQSNIDTSTTDEFKDENDVYNYFMNEYKLNEADVLEVVKTRLLEN